MSVELKRLRTREEVIAFQRTEKSWDKAKGFDLRWDGGVVYITQGSAQAIVPLSNVACMEPVEAIDVRPETLDESVINSVMRMTGVEPPPRRGPGRPKKTPPEAA